jgi:hypothetical protein
LLVLALVCGAIGTRPAIPGSRSSAAAAAITAASPCGGPTISGAGPDYGQNLCRSNDSCR